MIFLTIYSTCITILIIILFFQIRNVKSELIEKNDVKEMITKQIDDFWKKLEGYIQSQIKTVAYSDEINNINKRLSDLEEKRSNIIKSPDKSTFSDEELERSKVLDDIRKQIDSINNKLNDYYKSRENINQKLQEIDRLKNQINSNINKEISELKTTQSNFSLGLKQLKEDLNNLNRSIKGTIITVEVINNTFKIIDRLNQNKSEFLDFIRKAKEQLDQEEVNQQDEKNQ